jgi:hypothetical protein
MPGCPACGRPVAVARASCLYCGADLPESLRPAPAADTRSERPDATEAAVGPERSLLILDLEGVEGDALAALTGQSFYDVSRLVRRGGLRLHRALETATADEIAARFREAGVAVYVVPEGEARRRPLCASRGERTESGLVLHTPEGRLIVPPQELLLVVSGPIAREPAPCLERRRFDSSRLHESWCAHLHRIGDPRPLELDPRRIELGFTVTGSVQLELESWVDELGREVPHDESFRRETPALAPAPSSDEGSAAWPFESPHPRPRQSSGNGPPPVYDNLAQFRFYSGWRAAVERRRPGSRAPRGAC